MHALRIAGVFLIVLGGMFWGWCWFATEDGLARYAMYTSVLGSVLWVIGWLPGRIAPLCRWLVTQQRESWEIQHTTHAAIIPEPKAEKTAKKEPKTRAQYPALKILSDWYTWIAISFAAITVYGVITMLISMVESENKQFERNAIFAMVSTGVFITVMILACAEAIKVALNIASYLEEIRNELKKHSAREGD